MRRPDARRRPRAAPFGLRFFERLERRALLSAAPIDLDALVSPGQSVAFEAEAFAARTDGANHTWWNVPGERSGVGTFFGATTPYVQALSSSGTDTSIVNNSPAAPYVDYVVQTSAAGQYALDVRASGRTGGGSLWVRFEGAYAADTQGRGVNSSALAIPVGTSGFFGWLDAGVWNLPAGTTVLRVSMRESGAALDGLRIERVSPAAPPPPTTPAAPFELGLIEATAFHARAAGSGHQWWSIDGERSAVGQFTGADAGFLQALSDSGGDTTAANVNPAAPYVDYRVNVPSAGTYGLDLHVAGHSGGATLFARVENAFAADAQGLGVNASALLVSSSTTGAFEWKDAGIWSLPAGEQTIRVWMRESGAALDGLRLEAEALPPSPPPPSTEPPSTGDGPVVIEAEAFQIRQAAQSHQWWIVDAERASVGAFSGSSGPAGDFLQALSSLGSDTANSISSPTGPYADYTVDVPSGGRYDLDLRVAGRLGGKSLFVRVLDAYAADAQGLGVNSSALVVETNTSGSFVWQDAGIWQLPAGRQTIRVWMRESGAAIDSLRVSLVAAAPPPSDPPPTDPPPSDPPPSDPPPPPPPPPTFDTGIIQAESFTGRQTLQGHQWWIVDRERMSSGAFYGPSGPDGDFLQSLNASGSDTTTAINAPTGPYVDYVVNVPTSGRYELDLRLAGKSGGKSVFVRVLDCYAADTQGLGVNTSALVVEANVNGAFVWQDAGIWQIPTGQRTIRVWMRESGAAVDALQLQEIGPPVPATAAFALGAFQAETFHRRETGTGHQWWVVDAERSASGVFRGASGPSNDFLQALSTSGADSSQLNPSSAAPYVEYDIDIPQAGRYTLELNLAGKSGGNSLWARFLTGSLGSALGRPTSGGALQVDSDTSANFTWLTAGLWDLPAGTVTLRIGMRASGTALDAIRLKPFSLFLDAPTADGQWLQFRGDGALSGHSGLTGDITDPSIAWSFDTSAEEAWAALAFDTSSQQSLTLPVAGGVDRTNLLNEIWGIGGPYHYYDGGPRWWLVGRETDAVAALFSADGLPVTYLQALSDRALATGAAVGNPNGPYVEFVLSVPTAGAYGLRLDVAGLDAQHDSLFVEAVGRTLVDAQGRPTSGGALSLEAPLGGRFTEVAAGVWDLPAGVTAVRVAMNEPGAALQGLRLVDLQGQTVAAAAAGDLVRRTPTPTFVNYTQTPNSDAERIGDFLPNSPGLERLTFNLLGTSADGVVRLWRRDQGRWVQVWQTGTISWLGVQPNLITGDFDRDGRLEAAFAAWDYVYVLDMASGRVEQKARFTATGASSGRGYGWFGAVDLNGDGRREFVILADFENNMSVLGWNSSGQLVKLWSHTIESGVVDKKTIHNTGFDPLHDVNGDGVLDIVDSIYNESGDGRWHVVVRSGLNGAVLATLPGYFLWGAADLDGNGRSELFVSQAPAGAVVPTPAALRVVELQATTFQMRWQLSGAEFQTQYVPEFPDAVNAGSIGARQRLLVGQLEEGGPQTFFTRRTLDAASGQTEITAWQLGPGGIQAVGTLAGSRLEVLAVQPAPGEPSLLVRASSPRGTSTSIDAAGFVGEWLQTRRTGTPLTSVVVGPLAPGEQPTVVVQTPFEQLTAFQVSVDGSAAALWTQPGRGSYVGLNTITGQLGFGNVVLADLLGDGHLATLAGTRGAAGQARLVALAADGRELWGHDFDHIPGAPPEWNVGGLTVWMVGHFRSTEFMDVMVTVRRGTMHSDELYLLDGRTGTQVWTRSYGHNPGSSYVPRGAGGAQMAVVDWDGDGLDEAINVWPDAFYVVDGNGQNLVDRSFMGDVYGSLETQQGLPIVADFLANGSQTILHAGSQFVLALLDRLATPLWHTAYGSARTLWSPAVGDFDGDGDLDILSNAQNSATVSAYDGRTGTVRWSLALPGVPGAAVSGDIDGDGRDEALFAIGNTLYCVGAAPDGRSGRIEWTRTFSSAIGMPILADVTGTGQLQIVVVAQDGYVYGLA